MRRFERRRLERMRRLTLTIGSSFALGALTAVALTWRANLPADAAPPPAAVPRIGAGPPASLADSPVATVGPVPERDVVVAPGDRDLTMPVAGVEGDDLRDTFGDTRGANRPHEALDIMAPRGTPVRAVRDGHIAKLFTSEAGGLTIYQFDPAGTYAYYYAHLDRYAAGLGEGDEVERGQTIGYVGSSGNASADAPHLHFAIFRLTPERQWWKGEALNPYPLLK